MTDETASVLGSVPEACTLPTAEQPLRLAEFDALFTRAVRGGERLGTQHLRVSLAGGADLEASVRDLASREKTIAAYGASASRSRPVMSTCWMRSKPAR